jgi:hypothetical protein
MNRVVWLCLTCEEAGTFLSRMHYQGIGRRQVQGADRDCALWRCSAGHEHARVHERIGSTTKTGSGELWVGTPVRDHLVPFTGWRERDEGKSEAPADPVASPVQWPAEAVPIIVGPVAPVAPILVPPVAPICIEGR